MDTKTTLKYLDAWDAGQAGIGPPSLGDALSALRDLRAERIKAELGFGRREGELQRKLGVCTRTLDLIAGTNGVECAHPRAEAAEALRAVARIGRCESPRGLVDPSAEPEAIGLRRVERSRPWGVWSSRHRSWVMREAVAAFETEDAASAYAETYDDTKGSFRAQRFHEPEKKR